VLRVRDGENVEVFDGRGHAFDARLEKGEVIIGSAIASRESPLQIDLAMSIINLDKFELVLQKATELGVRSLIPVITDRMEIRPERFRGKTDRWLKIILEAVKQCGRSVIPTLQEPMTFDDAVTRDGVHVIFDADQPPTTDNRQPTTLFIGPEGGFSEREIELARARGCAFATLGPRRLRAETAAIVATALTQSRNGDL
jgi:16S rRNA (uracil1498-N3)-methyltransferase